MQVRVGWVSRSGVEVGVRVWRGGWYCGVVWGGGDGV